MRADRAATRTFKTGGDVNAPSGDVERRLGARLDHYGLRSRFDACPIERQVDYRGWLATARDDAEQSARMDQMLEELWSDAFPPLRLEP